ncbi:hypothetical protein U1Q18_016882 [Sarracenia purpurea var. burkii]
MVNVEITEALSGYRAVEIANSMGLKKLYLKGDALTVIQAINSTEKDKSYMGGIVEASKKLSEKLVAFSCTHTRRTSNAVILEQQDGEVAEDGAPNIDGVRVESAGAVQIRQDTVGGSGEERQRREHVRESDEAIDGE